MSDVIEEIRRFFGRNMPNVTIEARPSMSLIEDIKNEILDHKIPLSSIMRKAKVLAYKLENEQLKTWVDMELNGYARECDLPDYRRHTTLSVGIFVNRAWRTEQQVPTHYLPSWARDAVETINYMQGLSAIEDMLNMDQSKLQAPWDAVLIDAFNRIDGLSMTMVGAWRAVPKQHIIHVLDTVRNRLLSFILEIEALDPNAGDIPSIGRINPATTGHIFDRCIMTNYQGPVQNIQGNKGSNIATDSAKISCSSATYQGSASLASSLADLKRDIDDVGKDQRQHVLDAINLLVRAIDDHTLPKSHLVGAIETVAGKSPRMMDRLKSLCSVAAKEAGEISVQRAIEYVLQSSSKSSK